MESSAAVRNVWKGQIRVEVCPDADWKKAPFAGEPLKFRDFNVTSDDFDFAAYGQDALKKNVVTWIFFSLALLFLLLFLLWRFFRACCVVCCCADTCDERRKRNATILWTKKTLLLKVCALLVSLAATSMAAYSSSNLEITLSKDAWETIHVVKAKVASILDTGDEVLEGLDETIGPVRDIVISVETAIPEMKDNLTCIDSFLVDMPDSGPLETDIVTIDTVLNTQLRSELEDAADELATLRDGVLSDVDSAVADIQSSESWLADFEAELADLEAAIAALEPTGSDASAKEATAENLATAQNAIRDVDVLIAELEDLKLAVEVFSDSATTLAQITSFEANIATITADATDSISDASVPLQDAEDALDVLELHYVDTAPCVLGFLSSMNYIGQNVIELPVTVAATQALLEDIVSPLEEYFSDEAMAALADVLASMTAEFAPPDTSGIAAPLQAVEDDIAAISPTATTFLTALGSLLLELEDLQLALETLDDLTTIYLTPTQSAGQYTAMWNHATGDAATEVGETLAVLATLSSSSLFSVVADVDDIQTTIISPLNDEISRLLEMAALIDDSPDLSTVSALLDDSSSAYDTLPPDPTTLTAGAETFLDQVEADISTHLESIFAPVDDVSDDARSALEEARDKSVVKLEEFEAERRHLKVNHFADEPHDIGFSLLADDFNDKLYSVTLGFYCSTIVFCIALIFFVFVNCQFGVGLTLLLFAVVIFLYYLIALLSSTILTVENDFCANMEEFIINENSDASLDSLLRYYFSNEGSLRAVVLEAFELDFAEMHSQADVAATEAITAMGTLDATGDLEAALVAVPDSVTAIQARLEELEARFSYGELHPLYSAIKSYFCCDISAFLFTLWKDLTYAGALSLLTIFFGFLALHRIDSMPRVDCCGCTCRRRYMEDVLADSEAATLISKEKNKSRANVSRKGTQIGTDIA